MLKALSAEEEPPDLTALLDTLGEALSVDSCADCSQETSGVIGDDGVFRCCGCSFEAWTGPGTTTLESSRFAGGGSLQALCKDGLYGTEVCLCGRTLNVVSDPMRSVFAGTGTEPWPASLALLDYVTAEGAAVPQGCQVLELGAGCGVAGLWLARHQGAQVCLTDLPRLCPLLRRNAEVNGLDCSVVVQPLRWGHLGDLAALRGRTVDLVIGADLCYHQARVAPLLDTISALRPQRALLSLPDRSDSIASVKGCAKSRGWHWHEVSRRCCKPAWLQASLAGRAQGMHEDIVLVLLTCWPVKVGISGRFRHGHGGAETYEAVD